MTKELIGLASLVVALIGYYPYIKDILAKSTKPHAFSWLVWSVLSGIAFAVQVVSDGGPGAWLMGMTAVITFSVFLLALRNGEKDIVFADRLSLAFSAIALLLWFVTKKPLLSVIIIASIDAIGGFFPTFRKSIKHPEQETTILYVLYAISLGLSLAALRTFSLVNALYPASFVFINLFMAAFLIMRRKQLKPLVHASSKLPDKLNT